MNGSPISRKLPTLSALLLAAACALSPPAAGEDWPRWRGPEGLGVSSEENLPARWSAREGIAWKVEIGGEGTSSPIVSGDRIFLTSAVKSGTRRVVQCLDFAGGRTLWQEEVEDDNPELASSVTGHAAPTPATDGKHIAAFFGNAGVVCYTIEGKLLWRRRFGEFESELGIACSPIIDGGRVIVVCDHDGDRFTSFDSFLIALDVASGETVWKTERPKLYRSWSTPILVPGKDGRRELIVNAQDELRAYDPQTGRELWQAGGMTGWVAPSPVFAVCSPPGYEKLGVIFAASGRDGPTLAVRPGGEGNVTESHVLWSDDKGAPYLCSPLAYRGRLFVHTEQGVLTCRLLDTGEVVYRRRLPGKFWSSAVGGDGKVYITSEEGRTYVIDADDDEGAGIAENELGEDCLASPAVSRGRILIRTEHHLWSIRGAAPGS